jgi:hypothetical protein
MTRRLAMLAVLAVAGLGLLTGTSSAAGVKCIPNKSPGLEVVGQTTVTVFCGSAKLNITSAGKTTRYTGGACYKASGTLNVGMGKFTSLRSAPLFKGVLFVMPAYQDGVYRIAVITIQNKGKPTLAANHVKAVVGGNRSKGTFSGKFSNGPKFTGSFTCK